MDAGAPLRLVDQKQGEAMTQQSDQRAGAVAALTQTSRDLHQLTKTIKYHGRMAQQLQVQREYLASKQGQPFTSQYDTIQQGLEQCDAAIAEYTRLASEADAEWSTVEGVQQQWSGRLDAALNPDTDAS